MNRAVMALWAALRRPREGDNDMRDEAIGLVAVDHVDDPREDRLGHEAIANEIASLVRGCSSEQKANIALYGRWGAGKSSVVAMARRILRKDPTAVLTARYDAFKFAEMPLRRHFLTQVEKDLKNEAGCSLRRRGDREEAPEQYETKTVSRRAGIKEVWRAVALATLVLLALLALVSILAWLLERWLGLSALASGLAPVPILGFLLVALTPLIRNWATPARRQRQIPPLQSPEQFEAEFQELVSAVNGKRKTTVVFIDELDRCGPEQVVSTLEAIRTFLSVPGCILVVAADKHALEAALSEHAKQVTPDESAAPHYSSGSAYLDKIFDLSLEIPTARNQRLARFAKDLVDSLENPGIWADVPNYEYVLGDLVPVHVRSPRRVKTLLNSYAIAYDTARRYHEAGLLATHPRERARELAKLVCLRGEFPLFARDLEREPKLPEYVLAASDNEDLSDFDAEVRELAESYAKGQRAADVHLADRIPQLNPWLLGTSSSAEENQAKELVDYLRRTHVVPRIGRDLVHLEGEGAETNLSAHLTEELSNAAETNNTDRVADRIEQLDADDAEEALRFLASRTVDALEGERLAIARAILRTIARLDEDATRQAAAAIGHSLQPHAVLLMEDQGEEEAPEPQDVRGAVKIASHMGQMPEGRRLAEAALARDELGDEPEVTWEAVQRWNALDVIDGHDSTGRIPQSTATQITNHEQPEAVANSFAQLSLAQRRELAEFVGGAVKDRLIRQRQARDNAADDEEKEAASVEIGRICASVGKNLRALPNDARKRYPVWPDRCSGTKRDATLCTPRASSFSVPRRARWRNDCSKRRAGARVVSGRSG